MQQVKGDDGRPRFIGSLRSGEDLEAASRMAAQCPSYRIDEDDEDYLEGARSCFNCRYRRWMADGFSCVRPFPLPVEGC